MAVTKPIQIRIRIADSDIGILDELAGPVMSRTDVASVLLHAALEAVRANKGRVHFPPQFKVEGSEDASRWNEPTKPVRYTKPSK